MWHNVRRAGWYSSDPPTQRGEFHLSDDDAVQYHDKGFSTCGARSDFHWFHPSKGFQHPGEFLFYDGVITQCPLCPLAKSPTFILMTGCLFLAQRCGYLPGRISIIRATEIRLSTFRYQKGDRFRGIYCYLANPKENGVLFSIRMGSTCRGVCLPFGGSLKCPGKKTHHPLMLATEKLNAEHSSSRTHLKKLKCHGAPKCQISRKWGFPLSDLHPHTFASSHFLVFPAFLF